MEPGNPGGFTLQSVQAGDAFRFLANGYVPQAFTRDAVVAARQTANLQVRLKRGRELHGIVVDHKGLPAEGAKVIFAPLDQGEMPQTPFLFYWKKPGEGFTFATTGAAGRFALTGVSGNKPRLLAVSADGGLAQPAPVSDPAQDLKIVLPEAASLVVHCDIPGDQPQASFSLQLRTNEIEMPLWRDVKLDRSTYVVNGGETSPFL